MKEVNYKTKKAFERLTKTEEFQKWYKIRASQVMGILKTPEQIEKEVDDWTDEKYLKIEYYEPKNS